MCSAPGLGQPLSGWVPSSAEDRGRLFIKLYHSLSFIPLTTSLKDSGQRGYWSPSLLFLRSSVSNFLVKDVWT